MRMSKTRMGRVPSLCGSILAIWGAAGCGRQAPPEAQPMEQRAPGQRSPEVSFSQHNDSSPPLFLMPPAPREFRYEDHEVKMVPLPRPGPPSAVSAERIVQAQHALGQPLAPTAGLNFDGVGQGFGAYTVCCAPPDTNGDIGPNHYVETVNLDLAVFNKTSGALLFGPVKINSLWAGFGGGCQNDNDGDPVVLDDPIADRWVISQFAVTTTHYLECVAVSQTPDPTGGYFRYSFS